MTKKDKILEFAPFVIAIVLFVSMLIHSDLLSSIALAVAVVWSLLKYKDNNRVIYLVLATSSAVVVLIEIYQFVSNLV